MTPRSRQHERLRSLGLDPADGPRPLHESYAARRLRSRIPRPPLPDSPVPAAPYAVNEAGTEYRPQVARNMASPAHRRSSVPTPRHHAVSGPGGDAPEEDVPEECAGANPDDVRTDGRARAGASGRVSARVPDAGLSPGSSSGPAPEESTPLTEFLEESDTERLPPPARAGIPGRAQAPAHVSAETVDGPSSAHVTGAFVQRPAHVPDRAHAPGSDPDGTNGLGVRESDDLLEEHDTTRLRPGRVPSPRPSDQAPSGPAEWGTRNTAPTPAPGPGTMGRADTTAPSSGQGSRSGSAPEVGSEHGGGRGPGRSPDRSIDPRLWNEPPISALVLRHHRDVTPDTLPSGVPGTVPLGSAGTVTPGSDTTAPHRPNSPSGGDGVHRTDGAHGVDGSSGSGTAGPYGAYGMPGRSGVSGASGTPPPHADPGATAFPPLGTPAAPANAAPTGTAGTPAPVGTGDAISPSTQSTQGGEFGSPDDLDDLREGSGTVRLRPRGSISALPSSGGGGTSARGTSPAGAASRGPASLARASHGTASPPFGSANRPAATFGDMFPGPRFPDSHGSGLPDAANTSSPSDPSGRESTVRIPAARAHEGRSGTPSTNQDRPHRSDSPDEQPTTPRPPTTRRWVGHRPLSEQPREYRRPSWPAAPSADPRAETPAHGPRAHDRASGRHPSDDPPPDGPWNASFDAWPERDPDDSVTVPGVPANHDAPEFHIPAPPDSPWLDPADEELLKERRPPSGYVEFDPRDPADAPVNRLARLWGPDATLSKRAVIALFVLGAAAVVAALLFLRREPEDVDVPEMVPQSAPDGEDGEAGNGDEGSAGNGDAPDGSAEASGDGAGEDVVVHIGGDVEDPGLYTLPSGSRVLDAVEEAGGALPDADLDMVNLARPVVDGERILLGAEGDPDAAEAAEGGGGDAQRVSLNRADQSALEALPGIGEAKAGAILEHRESLGGSFSSVEDLLDVSGIGQSTFDNLEDQVTL